MMPIGLARQWCNYKVNDYILSWYKATTEEAWLAFDMAVTELMFKTGSGELGTIAKS